MTSIRKVSSLTSVIRVLALRGIGVLLSLGTAIGLAFFFGASARLDAFFLIRRFFGNVMLLLESASSLVLVPSYVRNIQAASVKAHLHQTGALELRCFVAGIAIALLLIYMAEPFIGLLAPGAPLETVEAAAFYFKLMAITLPITIATAITSAAMSAVRQFSLPVAVRMFPRIFILVAVLAVPFGMSMTGIVIAAVLGHIGMGSILWWRKRVMMRQLNKGDTIETAPPVKAIKANKGRVGAFVILSVYFITVSLSETYFASFAGVGAIAILALGQRISAMGSSEILASLIGVYYTNMSEKMDDPHGFRAEVQSALLTGLFFVIGLSLVLAVSGPLFAQLALANGAFSSSAAAQAGQLIILFAAAAIANVPASVLETAILAHPSAGKTRHFIVASSATLIMRVALMFWLVPLIGLPGIGIAAIAGPLVMAVLNYRFISGHIDSVINRDLCAKAGRIFVCAGLALGAGFGLLWLAPQSESKVAQILWLAGLIGATGVTYFVAAIIFRVEQTDMITRKIKKRLRR